MKTFGTCNSILLYAQEVLTQFINTYYDMKEVKTSWTLVKYGQGINLIFNKVNFV